MNDRVDISSLIGALAVHVDAREWDELLRLFAPQVLVDYVSLFGGEPQLTAREELLAGWQKLLPGFTRTCHVIGAPVVVVSGETAEAKASVVAWHFIKEAGLGDRDYWLVGGCYEFRFDKINGEWCIASLTLAHAWAEGNFDLPTIASERCTS